MLRPQRLSFSRGRDALEIAGLMLELWNSYSAMITKTGELLRLTESRPTILGKAPDAFFRSI